MLFRAQFLDALDEPVAAPGHVGFGEEGVLLVGIPAQRVDQAIGQHLGRHRLGQQHVARVPVAGVLGALIAVPVAALIFRLSGAYFAIGTWVAAEVYRLLFAQWKALGGGTGTSLPSDVARSIWGLEAVAALRALSRISSTASGEMPSSAAIRS